LPDDFDDILLVLEVSSAISPQPESVTLSVSGTRSLFDDDDEEVIIGTVRMGDDDATDSGDDIDDVRDDDDDAIAALGAVPSTLGY
jgi:hypothetical protein